MANTTIITDDMIALLQGAQGDSNSTPIEVLLPGTDEFAERRKLRKGSLGYEDVQPAGIAVPRDASEVARLVRWASAVGLKTTVRGGGNDFFARCIAHGGLTIDMREIKGIKLSEDRQTVVIGGGVVSRDLILALDEQGLMTPAGNVWIIGYAGWVSNGGYGPFTNGYGMGIEQVVGAELVNAKGEVVVADEEMLEGVRGMCGHLGVITSLTVKVYPKHDPLSGLLIFESSDIRKTMTAYFEAFPKLPVPEELTIHHFVMFNEQLGSTVFAVLWTWTGPDLEKGQAALQTWKDAAPPLLNCTVEVLPEKERQEQMPILCGLRGGQRSCYLARLPTGAADDPLAAALIDAAETMPHKSGPNVAWSGMVGIDAARMPPNCFVGRSHSYFSCSNMVPDVEDMEEADSWSRKLTDGIRSMGEGDVVKGGYPATNPPGEKTAEELYGEKWDRVKELKAKYDPTNVFSLAIPTIDL